MVTYGFKRLPASGEEIDPADLEIIAAGGMSSAPDATISYAGDNQGTRVVEIGFRPHMVIIVPLIGPYTSGIFTYYYRSPWIRFFDDGYWSYFDVYGGDSRHVTPDIRSNTGIDVGLTTGAGWFINTNNSGTNYRMYAWK